MKKIIPAILSDKLSDIKDKIKIAKSFTDWVQIDIADNKFVSNKTIEVKDLEGVGGEINLELHLMVKTPSAIFADCEKAQAKRVIVHLEAVDDIEYVLHEASMYDFEFGVAINPATPVKLLEAFIGKIDLVLLMAVEPGFSGQVFKPEVLQKVKEIKLLEGDIKIEIDGGINHDTIQLAQKAGVNLFVVGSALFEVDDVADNYKRLLARI